MFIGITGLHGSGKSYFAHNIPTKYGFLVYYKNDIIADIFNYVPGWEELYRKEYQRDPRKLILNILSRLPLDRDIVLDAIHNNNEWNIIKSIIPNAMLLLVTAPKEIRISRRKENIEKDMKRIQYWHKIKKDNTVDCLLTQVSWSFNGNASLESNSKNFEEFLKYARNKELEALVKEDNMINAKLKKAKEVLGKYEKAKEQGQENQII